jgi:hypothetical protein
VTNARLLAAWAALLLIAWFSHPRVLRFCWLFLMLAPLPVAFLSPRGAAQYIPWFGWVLFGSVMLVRSVEYVTRGVTSESGALARGIRIALLPALALVLFPHYKREGWENVYTVSMEAPLNRDIVEQLHALYPRFPPGSRLLFKDDPIKPSAGSCLSSSRRAIETIAFKYSVRSNGKPRRTKRTSTIMFSVTTRAGSTNSAVPRPRLP